MIVTASVNKDFFKLHFERGNSAAYPVASLRRHLRFYRRMARLHPHPSYAATATALQELSDSLGHDSRSRN